MVFLMTSIFILVVSIVVYGYVYAPLACTGNTTHRCSSFNSVSSIDHLIAPNYASCGRTINLIVGWTGWHWYDPNHWGIFLDSKLIGSCKSYKYDSKNSHYNMTCYVTIPNDGSVCNGIHKLTVTGNDYRGYCNPNEYGVDAQSSREIELINCGVVTTTTTVSTTTTTVLTTTTTISDFCTDSDGGFVVTVQGNVSGYLGGWPYCYTDFCNGTITLIEYSCWDVQPHQSYVDCTVYNATSCVNGACI